MRIERTFLYTSTICLLILWQTANSSIEKQTISVEKEKNLIQSVAFAPTAIRSLKASASH